MTGAYWENCYADRAPDPAAEYDGWLRAYEELLKPGMRVLDLGCGAGTNIEALLERGVCLTAADFSENAVSLVQNRFGKRLHCADCFDMQKGFPYGESSFDGVVADLSLHYFTWKDTQNIIDDLRRVLSPGGVLLARVHSMKNLDADQAEQLEYGYYCAYGYPRRYFVREDISALFANWEIISLSEANANRYGRIKRVFEFAAMKPDSL